ncbi:MAG TPA: hypothetical protein VLW50_18075 [Streptosporangiaceae bacterium]|nr:hypothetical protein [Streptosporangiaceae bacterium]
MFHAINAWLARQARRARDYRLARDNAIAAANGWQVQRVAGGTYRYRDPCFAERHTTGAAPAERRPEAVMSRRPQ